MNSPTSDTDEAVPSGLDPGHRAGLIERIIRAPIDFIAILAACIVVLLPIVDLAASRLFYKAIPGASSVVDHFVLVLAW
ncbi:MAG: hypothetical protein WCQ50_17470 [Spirochaetota bacterium]